MSNNSDAPHPPWLFSAGYMGWAEGGRMDEYHTALNKLSAKRARQPYSAEIQTFYVHFKVGGSFGDYKTEGPQGARIYRPGRHITQTIHVPVSRWSEGDTEFRLFLLSCIAYGSELIHAKLQKARIEYDSRRMDRDLDWIMSRVFAGEWPPSVAKATAKREAFVQEVDRVLSNVRKTSARCR
jgi:succinate dehydrogenase flavin-adding protein (antitoxin of CptAB toxin-antitoxin module)